MMGILGHVEGNRAIIPNSMLSSSLYVSLTLVLLLNSISLMCVWIWILSSRMVISILRLPTRSSEALATDKNKTVNSVKNICLNLSYLFSLCLYLDHYQKISGYIEPSGLQAFFPVKDILSSYPSKLAILFFQIFCDFVKLPAKIVKCYLAFIVTCCLFSSIIFRCYL